MAQLSSKECVDARLRAELKTGNPVATGKSKGARLVQELLRLNGINVVIDGDFGPATAAGLSAFAQKAGLVFDGSVPQSLIDALAQPLLRAAAPATPAKSLGDTVSAVAKRHLAEHPIEVGGPNRGPWVRFYMNGAEGADYPWCAGFATYVVHQAARAHGVDSPIPRTFSCDRIATSAKARPGKLLMRVSPTEAPAGSLFLVPHAKNEEDWVHTGIIIESDKPGPGTVFTTIEGNTNDEGSRDGYEVCKRYRGCSKVDVVLL